MGQTTQMAQASQLSRLPTGFDRTTAPGNFLTTSPQAGLGGAGAQQSIPGKSGPSTASAPAPQLGGGVPLAIGSGALGGSGFIDQAGGLLGRAGESLLSFGRGPIDDSLLQETLASIQQSTSRQAATAGADAASRAFGAGGLGTSAQAVAGQSVADVLERSEALQNRTALDFLTQTRGQNLSALSSAGGLGTSLGQLGIGAGNLDLGQQQAVQNALFGIEGADLARTGQAFQQELAAQGQQAGLLNQLFQAGALPRQLEQQNIQALLSQFTQQQNAALRPFQILTSLMSGTPLAASSGAVPDLTTPALIAAMGGKGTAPSQPGSPDPSVPGGHGAFDTASKF